MEAARDGHFGTEDGKGWRRWWWWTMLVTVIANEKCDYTKSKMRYKWKILCAIDDSPESRRNPYTWGGWERGRARAEWAK